MKVENKIKYTKEFDEKFRYDGKDLGAVCTKEKTVFKLWSPLADKVTLFLYDNGCITEGEERKCIDMEQGEQGVWKAELSGDFHGTYYDYEILRGTETIQTADPYAVGCGCNGYRSMIIDLRRTDPDGFAQDKAPEAQTEQIIYELHIKDFSYDPDSGIPAEYRGKYKAFTINGSNGEYKTCVDYLKELGVTHVHLLPFYDFAALDEAGNDNQFNWGYDPLNYNVPEGSFATDSQDGSVRIKECKEMIQALHQAGIRVVMDVVYNHTYSEDSWMERTVPGYFNRTWEDGSLANGSACGSDVAAGRAMVDNYIANSVMYWAKEYHMDGFRFDLMGLLTVELMNRIREELDAEFGKNEKLLYGEPWRAEESPMEEGTHAALKDNLQYLDENIAVFSDDIRDVVKGDVFIVEEPGFVNGASYLEDKILYAVSAWRKGGSYVKPKSCSQIISYVSAHDNYTLWDKLVLTMKKIDDVKAVLGDESVFAKKNEDVIEANKLAALIYFTCQGHVFFQAGEEFGRTKLGDENSYRSDPKINMLKWSQTVEYAELLDYYKGLIALRKNLPGLYDKSADAYTRISEEKVHEKNVVSFVVDNNDSENTSPYSELFIAYNAGINDAEIAAPDGEWIVLANNEKTNCCLPLTVTAEGMMKVAERSGIILGKKRS